MLLFERGANKFVLERRSAKSFSPDTVDWRAVTFSAWLRTWSGLEQGQQRLLLSQAHIAIVRPVL